MRHQRAGQTRAEQSQFGCSRYDSLYCTRGDVLHRYSAILTAPSSTSITLHALKTTRFTISRYSSIKPSCAKAETMLPLPNMTMSLPSCCFRFKICPAIFPLTSLEFCHSTLPAFPKQQSADHSVVLGGSPGDCRDAARRVAGIQAAVVADYLLDVERRKFVQRSQRQRHVGSSP